MEPQALSQVAVVNRALAGRARAISYASGLAVVPGVERFALTLSIKALP